MVFLIIQNTYIFGLFTVHCVQYRPFHVSEVTNVFFEPYRILTAINITLEGKTKNEIPASTNSNGQILYFFHKQSKLIVHAQSSVKVRKQPHLQSRLISPSKNFIVVPLPSLPSGGSPGKKRCANLLDEGCANNGLVGSVDDESFLTGGGTPGKRSASRSRQRSGLRCLNLFDDGCGNTGLVGSVDDESWMADGSPGKRSTMRTGSKGGVWNCCWLVYIEATSDIRGSHKYSRNLF